MVGILWLGEGEINDTYPKRGGFLVFTRNKWVDIIYIYLDYRLSLPEDGEFRAISSNSVPERHDLPGQNFSCIVYKHQGDRIMVTHNTLPFFFLFLFLSLFYLNGWECSLFPFFSFS